MKKMAARDLWTWLGGFSLDFRLALRMLAKYPLLTIVGGAGMAFGIAAGVGGFEIRSQMLDPVLPLDDGRSIVGLRNWDVRSDRPVPLGDADFRAWLERLQSVQDLGAVALLERNLTVNGDTEPIDVAEMTASGFRIARVPPLLGRTLVAGDESPGAPPVAVIGHSLWQRRFLGDPRIVGRAVRLGLEQTTIVGVMPEEFRFPINHELWIPLRHEAMGRAPDARALHVFGRLAKGVTRDSAQTELTTIGRRMASDAPDTHEFLLPQVVPYAHLIFDPRNFQLGLNLANVFLVMLILVVAANVALLMYARAANEMGVRNALGASRGRIVAQLFIEAIALSGLSVIAGLAGARYAIGSLLRTLEADSGTALPFWLNDRLMPSTVAFGVGLTMLGAVITGVVPGLKVTARGLHDRLRSSTAGGGGGYRFGGVWTAVIVTQVAVTVVFPATAFFFHRWVVGAQARNIGFPAEEYLSARLVIDPMNAPVTASATQPEIGRRTMVPREELRRQLTGEPGVTAVTFASRLPGMQHPSGRFEVEGDEAPPTSGYEAAIASVDADFFGALRAPVLSGRSFAAIDLTVGEVAIVNTPFVEHVMRGRNPLGRRIRRVPPGREQPTGPWIEIVGVARDLGMTGPEGIGLYRPLAPDASTVHMALHVGGAPEALSRRLRALATAVEPTLRVYDVKRLDDVGADRWLESQYVSRLVAVMSALALLLSLMAIYSVTAFTVVQRTREIGLRVALGAAGWRIVVPIIRRPLLQIGLGIGVGTVLVVATFVGMFSSAPGPVEAVMLVTYVLLMLGVSLLACSVPTRRALRLEPSQVLRADA